MVRRRKQLMAVGSVSGGAGVLAISAIRYRRGALGRPTATPLTRTCSEVYGSNATCRARFTAVAIARWHFALQPTLRRPSIWPCSFRNRRSDAMSL
jgi:hypothetical protein